MKKAELKRVLKPLIKDCIKEVLFEDGILSGIISEVVKGINPTQQVLASSPSKVDEQKDQTHELEREKLLEEKLEAERQRRINVLNATGFSEVFDGLEPLAEAGTPNAHSGRAQGPLSGVDPKDSGVDISGIMALGGKHWKQMVK